MARIRSLGELTGEESYISSMLPLEKGLIVKDGHIFLPTLYNSDIERIIAEDCANPSLATAGGRAFVKSLDLRLLVEDYGRINPDRFKRAKKTLLERYDFDPQKAVTVDPNLKTIIYEIMPHFTKSLVRGEKGARKMTEREIIDKIASSVSIPESYYKKAEELYNTSDLVKDISRLESKGRVMMSAPDNITTAKELDSWFLAALEESILSTELEVLKRAMITRSEVSSKNKEYIATLLYLQDKPSFELDGFGFQKSGEGRSPGYTVYARTGKYALKDFDGRVYLLGDAKVAIQTEDMWPKVLGSYRHPFLSGGGGRLCIVHYNSPGTFNGPNAIKALTTGFNTMFYGYIRSSNFHPYNHLDDGGYDRISENDPRIKSGEIEIKNASLV